MKAVIVGAGPVGCLLAVALRQRRFDVELYERSDDPREAPRQHRHSLNLTVSRRGLAALEPEVATRLEKASVRVCHRVIHQQDGHLLSQPYGPSGEYHLLSIPRRVLHVDFLTDAERAGASLRFGHDCIHVDPRATTARFRTGSARHEAAGDLLVGCDGANSVVRHEMARRVGLGIVQGQSEYGYIELHMPPWRGAEHPLSTAARTADPTGSTKGFHVWPRGNFMLIAQPNVDDSYTATLFLPLRPSAQSQASFEHLVNAADLVQFFARYFPDASGLLPVLDDVRGLRPPTPLKTVRCEAFHHQQTLLLGDAAHTMLPFYGQGINCSFEDLHVLLKLLDHHLACANGGAAIRGALSELTSQRRPPCDAIADLSEANLRELAREAADARFHTRARLEMNLFRRHPTKFVPLYCGVAFSTTPYHRVVKAHREQRRRLDALYETFDPAVDSERIIEEYAATEPVNAARTSGEAGLLKLSRSEQKNLLDLVTSRILAHESDLDAGKYPASYVHDSIDVASYDEGRRLSTSLREPGVPRRGVGLETLLSEIFDLAIAGGTIHSHPGFMAHIPSGGLIEGAAGTFMATALNRFAGVWVAAPGLAQIESNVIRWFCRLLGYDDRSFGYLTTSGSIANMMGLMCACRRAEESTWASQAIYMSEQGHFSIRKAARLVGIGPSRIRIIPVRPDYSMNLDVLAAQMDADRLQGLRPTCVVATAGTTNTGAIDDLPQIAAICQRQGVWLHVDGCFGGFFRITARGQHSLRGIETADSIAVDGHKSLFLPHGNSALLVKERASLASTFEVPDAAYLPGTPSDDELVDFCSYGPELSREIRGLAAWLPIKMHGIDAFARCLDERLEWADALAAALERIPGVRVIRKHPLHLPVVAFKWQSGGHDDAEATRRLCTAVCARRRVYVTTTVLPDEGIVLRACILSHRTRRETVDVLIEDVKAAIQEGVVDAARSNQSAGRPA